MVRRRPPKIEHLKEKIQDHEKSQNEPLLSPAEIAQAGPNDTAVREKIDGRIEEYMNVAVMDWLPEAYLNAQSSTDGLADVQPALGVLADIAIQKHADRWLADLLASASSPSFAPGVAKLSAALKSNDTGDNIAARQNASAGGTVVRIRGERGWSAPRKGGIYVRLTRRTRRRRMRSGGPRNFTSTRYRDYPWLKAQYLIEQGNCVWFRGNMGKARLALDRAAKEAEASAYGAVYLRAQDQLSHLHGTIGDLPSAWANDRAALARFWSGHYPAMRGYNLYFGCYEFARAQQQPHLQLSAWRDGLALSECLKDNVIRAMAHSLMADVAIAVEQPQTAERNSRVRVSSSRLLPRLSQLA